MSDDLKGLVEITDLLHVRALDEFRRRGQEVDRINGELDEISALRDSAQADTDSLEARRLIGSDTMWQGWLAGRTTELQQQMAIGRALQLESLARAQSTFARMDAARKIEEAAARDRKDARTKHEADRLEWLSAMIGWSRNED